MMQLHLLLNQLVAKFHGTRKRNLVLHIPLVIPITPRVRLMGDHESFTSLGQVYEQHCVTENKDIEYPLTVYQNEMTAALPRNPFN